MSGISTLHGPLPPVLSQSLQRIVDARPASVYGPREPLEADGGLRIACPMADPTPDQVSEARRVLDGYVALQRPTRASVRQWLMALNAAVGNTQPEATFAMRLGALSSPLAEYPAAVFGQESLNDAIRSFAFWPAGKELLDLLDRHLQAIRDTEAALRRIATWRPPELDQQHLPDDAERERVAAKLAAWRLEQQQTRLAQEQADQARAALPDVTLRPAELLRIYAQGERDGNVACAMRAHSLRQQLGITEQETAT